MCACQSREAIECYALLHGLPFYKAMGFGLSCACACHTHSDAQMVENFKRFLREVGEAGIYPVPVPEDVPLTVDPDDYPVV